MLPKVSFLSFLIASIIFLSAIIVFILPSKPAKNASTSIFCGGFAGVDAGGTCRAVSEPECKIGGCSGELCLDVNSPDVASVCIYRDEYACYKNSICEKQSSGTCAWTKTQEYLSCIQNLKTRI